MIFEIINLINGPIFKIVDKLIPDPELKLKLKTEVEKVTRSAQVELVKAQRDVVLAEYEVDSRITKLWRPCLMFLAMFIILLYGVILPFLNLFLDAPVAFSPLWQKVPDGVWELLKWGVGGYVGGRSFEKIAATAFGASRGRKPLPPFRRRFMGKRIM